MALEKNTYGLSEGVFQACQFLGLKFPQQAIDKPQPTPADYFGDDIKLSPEVIRKLRSTHKWSEEKFKKQYEGFSAKYFRQKPLKHTQTDLNVYFCDYVLFSRTQYGSDFDDYFDFEFYDKSFETRSEFLTNTQLNKILSICNDYFTIELAVDKAKTNKLFADYLHREWIDTRCCTFEEFKSFVESHPRFFSKLSTGLQGRGAQIIQSKPNQNLEELFADLKSRNRLLEEIVVQHEDIASLCPDTVNTIRVYTLLDIHNFVHIISTVGRIGIKGGVVDNVNVGNGYAVAIDSETGIITSDGLSKFHEHVQKHPDTGKTFKGFQYPGWGKMRAVVKEMARLIPQLRYIGWDIAINDKEEVVLIEVNGNKPDNGLQQEADSVGKFNLYIPLIEEIQNFKREQMRFLGWRVNNLPNFDSAYESYPMRPESRFKFAMTNLVPDCTSLMELGCRKKRPVKLLRPTDIEYYPVDYKKHDDEIILCDFNKGEFPALKVDTCFCAYTAEFVEHLPQFLANMCNAAQKQVLMWCRPIDKELRTGWRWRHPFLVDFTEEFLIKTMVQNNFQLHAQFSPDNPSVILYDFRRTETAVKPSSVISDYYTLAITKNLSSEDGLLKLSARQDLSTSLNR